MQRATSLSQRSKAQPAQPAQPGVLDLLDPLERRVQLAPLVRWDRPAQSVPQARKGHQAQQAKGARSAPPGQQVRLAESRRRRDVLDVLSGRNALGDNRSAPCPALGCGILASCACGQDARGT